jgi:hypothetical protein
MKIITNEKLISRNNKIGSIASIGGLVVLGISTYIAFQFQHLIYISFILVLLGFLLSQLGIHNTNRFGRRTRPDGEINKALKPLNNSYTILHFKTPVSHLLIGPAGIWVLIPRNTQGIITYTENKKRWRQDGGNLYLKIFAQAGLGRPDLEIKSEMNALKKFMKKHWDGDIPPDIFPALIFTQEGTLVDAENAPVPTMHINKLKGFIKNQGIKRRLSNSQVNQLISSFVGETTE